MTSDKLITVCLSVVLLGFKLLGILWASWVWMSISPSTLGEFSAIIALVLNGH